MALFAEKEKYLKRVNITDLLFSLSLANLTFIKIWNQLIFLHAKGEGRYYFLHAPTPLDYGAAMANVLLLALLIYLACKIIRNNTNNYMRSMAIVLVSGLYALALGSTLRVHNVIDDRLMPLVWGVVANKPLLALVLLVFFALIVLAGRWGRTSYLLGKVLAFPLLILSPFVLFTFAQGLYYAIGDPYGDEFKEQPRPPYYSTNLEKRVVVLVFDEADYRCIFLDRPAWLQLPAFDSFRNNYFHAENALPPANFTKYALPALITGKMLEKITIVGANDLLLTEMGTGQTGLWSKTPTIFSEVRKLVLNSGLVGFSFHPYHRIIQKDLQQCLLGNILFNYAHDLDSSSFVQKMYHQYLTIIPGRGAKGHLPGRYVQLVNYGRKMVGDRQLQLVFIHYPFPHAPYVFDYPQGELRGKGSAHDGYFGNLSLADKTLADVRKEMEDRGLWDESFVIVTSDHWWREADNYTGTRDRRIPFLVKFPRMSEAYTYEKRFNTVVLKEIILAFFRGEIADGPGLAAWLDRHGQAVEPVIKPMKLGNE